MKALNAAIVRTLPLVPKPIVKRFASRYVAGETLEQAMALVARLNGEGCMATLDVLGEDVTRRESASRRPATTRRPSPRSRPADSIRTSRSSSRPSA